MDFFSGKIRRLVHTHTHRKLEMRHLRCWKGATGIALGFWHTTVQLLRLLFTICRADPAPWSCVFRSANLKKGNHLNAKTFPSPLFLPSISKELSSWKIDLLLEEPKQQPKVITAKVSGEKSVNYPLCFSGCDLSFEPVSGLWERLTLVLTLRRARPTASWGWSRRSLRTPIFGYYRGVISTLVKPQQGRCTWLLPCCSE